MKRIVLLRHGESLWNQENKFTGWTDVDLSPKGIQEAIKAGDLLKEKGFVFDKAYTSYLKRAIKTQNYVLDRLDQDWIPGFALFVGSAEYRFQRVIDNSGIFLDINGIFHNQ